MEIIVFFEAYVTLEQAKKILKPYTAQPNDLRWDEKSHYKILTLTVVAGTEPDIMKKLNAHPDIFGTMCEIPISTF